MSSLDWLRRKKMKMSEVNDNADTNTKTTKVSWEFISGDLKSSEVGFCYITVTVIPPYKDFIKVPDLFIVTRLGIRFHYNIMLQI